VQLTKDDCKLVTLKLVGNINDLKLKQLLKVEENRYLAFAEQVEGKYTFSKDTQLRNILLAFTNVEDAKLGNPLNFTHNKPVHVEKVLLNSVHKFILGIVIFFNEIQLVKPCVIVVQLFKVVGSDTVLKERQFEKVIFKLVIPVALLGKVISNKLIQF
jgi:hypothetical protein